MRINIKMTLALLLCAVQNNLLAETRKPPVAGKLPMIVQPDFIPDLNLWNIIAIGLSALAIILSCLAIKSKRRRRTSSSSSGINFQGDSLKEDPNFLFESLSKRLQLVESQLTELKSRQLTNKEEEKAGNKASNTPAIVQPNIIIKYAKTADGNAFDADALSDLQDHKKIYELTIEGPDKGSFRVTTNKEAQLFALEDPNNYLRCACNYRSFPSHNSTIITDTPGRIERQGSKWAITKPAEIDFS